MKPALTEQILTILAEIPPGRVTTYGRIAAMTEGATPRMVARALRELPSGHELPWFRVITASRRLADHGGADEQRRRLIDEGVAFDARGRVAKERLWP
ncbi:MGMT family protein [Halomonas elongata]|uniref:HTH domain protein n=1 Tax=Halomonas elongata (strain ATCC 33173 / DSM 2581 / NBRC 15536 / NCIMB 2198 / 1H9) TaxID=768066 RepID=E1VAN7_HALED|nr:MGMT family protein [Halomonas elongata]MBW5801894.1 MGMT family protein [Halomonas elongata]RAW06939.1 cysteine methyltransferase [Halomonas elongata]WBF17739.1 MGMT family protein [Halomonas elongata]WPU46584.1 MGMT family protein [Halomonas elongata DSM 2581]WVI71348.1 MGMT family protein [Halomonas elongata]